MVEEGAMSPQPSIAAGARPFAPYSFDTLVSGAARLRSEAIAVADRTTACPFGILATQAAALARLFADCGLRPSERLLLTGGAEVSLVISLIAALRGGFEPALAPLDLGASELADYAHAINAAALIGPTAYGELDPTEAYFAVAAAVPSIRLVATLGPGEIDGAIDLSASAVSRYAIAHPDDGLERGKPVPTPPRIITLDRARLKPVVHEQTTLIAAGLDFAARAEIGRATPILSTLPPTSFVGLVAGPFAALPSGATLYLHGPFAAEDFLKARDRAGHAHLIFPAAAASDLASAAVLEGLASAVFVSRLSANAGFTSPPPFDCGCPLVDLYGIDECAAVAERRRGARAVQPAEEPHFVGLDEGRVLTIERTDDQALAFGGAAVTVGQPMGNDT
jgi:acyl-CoA synthetase (AMP-forming)/AMP-acid ligase II